MVQIYSPEQGERVLERYRLGEHSWNELLLDLNQRGLRLPPKVAVGDSALAFFAIHKMFLKTRTQRSRILKPAYILNRIAMSVQPKAKGDLYEIWQTLTKNDANQAFDTLLQKYRAKYARAYECLAKDRDVL